DERHLQPIGDVRALLRGTSSPAETGWPTVAGSGIEQALEQVTEVAGLTGEVEPFEAAPAARRARMRPSSARIASKARSERHFWIAVLVDFPAVVAGALVLVGQQVIGRRDLAKALGGVGLVLVAVRVKLLGEASICLLDL